MEQSSENPVPNQGLSVPVKYPIYMRDPQRNIVFELVNDFEVNYVQVLGYRSGAFRHHRGRTLFRTKALRDEHLQQCQESNLERWIQIQKDYFSIDREVREAFIKKYNLG